MIYLSKLTINAAFRPTRRDLASPYEFHRTVLKAFNTKRKTSNVLFRVEPDRHFKHPTVLVQSTTPPNWSRLHNRYLLDIDTKSINVKLPTGQSYRFRLRACPSKKVRAYDPDTGERKRNSERVFFYKEKDQCQWLQKRASQHGFSLKALQISQPLQRKDHHMKCYSVLFEGRLTITNTATFHQAWRTGIGPIKAVGCGLLSLSRI